MSETVDARGLSCPQPVMETLDAIKRLGSGHLEVLVDTDTSKENVSRAALSQGWQVSQVAEEGEGYRILLTKG
jgi:tRNA 2-thiouridine synthesizing protein A